MIFNIIFTITSVFQTYEFYLLLECFLKKSKKARLVLFLSYLGIFFMITVPNLVINIPIVNLICAYISILFASLMYEGKIRTKILSTTLIVGIMVLAECVVAVLSGYVGLSLFQSTEYYSIFGTVCLPVLEFMIVLIIRNFKNMSEGEDVSVPYWIISITLPIMTVYMLLLFYRQKEISSFDIISCNFLLIIINIFVFYLYDNQMNNFRVKQEKENLELQNQYQLNELQIMHSAVEKSRSLRHDFGKHMSMISYFNENGEKDKLAHYLEEINENVKWNHEYVNTGNFVFDSILNYKMQEAVSLGIDMSVKIHIPAELEISTYDMNVILSNIMENSIEAAAKTKDKKIEIEITYSKRRLKIDIKNSFNGLLVRESGNYISTKRDKENHGYGIRNVQTIVEKYEGIINIKNSNDMFEIFICLFL